MTIVQLEYLIAIANYESFSVASEHCFVTQPSLSTQIKNLENELGVILINRNVKTFELTEAGRIVIEKAKIAIAEFYNVKESVNSLKNTYSGKLRLAVIPTIAPYVIHKFGPVFLEKYKDIDLEVSEMYTADIVKALNHDTIDIALLAGGFTPKDTIKEVDLYRDNFILYCSEKSNLYHKKEVDVKDIDLAKIMLLADGHCFRTQVMDFCGARTLTNRRIRFESGSLETLMRLVDTTDAVTVIPQMAYDVLNNNNSPQFKPFINEGAYRNISLATSKYFVKHKLFEALRDTLVKLNKIETLEREMIIK